MKLTLLGIAGDREKLEAIAAGIAALGHDARYLFFADAPRLPDGMRGRAGSPRRHWTAPRAARPQGRGYAARRPPLPAA